MKRRGYRSALVIALQKRGMHVFATACGRSKMSHLAELTNVTLLSLEPTLREPSGCGGERDRCDRRRPGLSDQQRRRNHCHAYPGLRCRCGKEYVRHQCLGNRPCNRSHRSIGDGCKRDNHQSKLNCHQCQHTMNEYLGRLEFSIALRDVDLNRKDLCRLKSGRHLYDQSSTS